MVQVRIANVMSRARVHSDGVDGRRNVEVGERSRDMECGTCARGGKLAYAQPAAKQDVCASSRQFFCVDAIGDRSV